jgi:hypothetical protein
MADISAMRGQLVRLRQDLFLSPVFVAGRPDDADKVQEEWKRLGRIADSVKLIIRELNSAENLLLARESQLRKVPPAQRYSAEQSLKQLAENVRTLREEAQSLADLARDLLDRNGLLNPLQKAQSLMELAGNLEKGAGQEAQVLVAQAIQAAKQPAYVLPSNPGSPLTISGVTGLVAFVYIAIKVLQKKLESKGT